MSTIHGSAHTNRRADLLPVVHNERLLNWRLPLSKRALRVVALFLVAFCIGVAATLVSQSYGDAARQMIANSYPQLGWLAPRPLSTAQKVPGVVGLVAPTTPSFDQQQLNAMSFDEMRQSVDRIAAGQEQITRRIDQIATSVTAGEEQMTRRIDQIATNIAAGQEQMTRSIDQIAVGVAAGQEQMTRGTNQTATNASHAPSAQASSKPSEARVPQTLSERGKQLSPGNEHDASCFPSASAVLQDHPGARPTWTLNAPGHAGTMCWYASARPRGRDHRSEMQKREPE
jgi:hypothetical protein